MEDYDRIKALLKGSDMVFIAAGAGGGTGTGAAPDRRADRARDRRADRRHRHEAVRLRGHAPRRSQADDGVQALADEVDTLIVVPNNRLLSVLDKGTSMVDAFRVADDVLRQGVQGISDLVTLPGLINLDFADVRTIMSDAGQRAARHRHGRRASSRAIDAAEQAVASPLLETSMEGARSILLSITGGTDLSLWEVNEAAKAVSEAAHPDANIIFGAMVDEKLDDQVLGHGRRDRLRRAARRRAARDELGAAGHPHGAARAGRRAARRVAHRRRGALARASSTCPSSCRALAAVAASPHLARSRP